MTAAALLLAWAAADPPPGDAYRLPPVKELGAGRVFNRAYQQHLQWRLLWEPDRKGELNAALAEARWLFEVWDAAEGAHPEWSGTAVAKARYLRKLRLLLGREAYLKAELPPCVPTWRFHELR